MLGFVAAAGFAAAEVVTGPPEEIKGMVPVVVEAGRCGDRLVSVVSLAKSPEAQYASFLVYEDATGPFLWLFYAAKDESAEAEWGVLFDGAVYERLHFDELAALYPSPCDIPRPAKLKSA